jgi:phage gp37-like protein
MTEKDYSRQFDLYASVFSRYAGEAGEGNGGGDRGPRWGAYVLQSEFQVVDHDRRFSSQKAALTAMLHISIDNFRRRNFNL